MVDIDISEEDLRKEIAVVLKDADLIDTFATIIQHQLEMKLGIDLQSRKKEINNLTMEFVSGNGAGKKKDSSKDFEEGKEAEEYEEESEEEIYEEGSEEEQYGEGSEEVEYEEESDEDEYEEGSEEDIYEEGSEEEIYEEGSEEEEEGESSYTKPVTLSPELAALVGQEVMARHEVVKKIWTIIKQRDLYDPKNKQYAICDDALFKVIGVKRFRTFGMVKYLEKHFSS